MMADDMTAFMSQNPHELVLIKLLHDGGTNGHEWSRVTIGIRIHDGVIINVKLGLINSYVTNYLQERVIDLRKVFRGNFNHLAKVLTADEVFISVVHGKAHKVIEATQGFEGFNSFGIAGMHDHSGVHHADLLSSILGVER